MSLRADIRVERGGFALQTSLEAADGETIALLGPNGSGKSTLVAALAGLVDVGPGSSVVVDDVELAGLPPERRPIGVVFQEGLLFPHLSALDNAGFALRARGTARDRARAEAADLLERLGLPRHRHGARPDQLSGGEAQRVALARALIARPRLLLLDEPTSALDVRARAAFRPLLRRILEGFDGVRILVTHDPVEAMTLADRIVVIEDGRVSQTGPPDELRQRPATSYVAEVVGVNLYTGTLVPIEAGAGRLDTREGSLVVAWPAGLDAGAPVADVAAVIRPADVGLHLAEPEGGSARNRLHGPVAAISLEGERARVRLDSRPPIVAEVTLGSITRLGLAEGSDAWATCKAVEIRLELPEADARASDAPPGTLPG